MPLALIPLPAAVVEGDGRFSLAGAAVRGEGEAAVVASYLGELLGIPTAPDGAIELVVAPGESPASGGYQLSVTPTSIRIGADAAAGLFNGVQTLRQLISEGHVPSITVEDYPRFEYRGAMLDVARHFFPVDTVKRYIDDIARLKLNYLHLHLTDDQGWRLQIDSWPLLTALGSTSQVGGGGGGFYTKDDFREIVSYAASRFITIVPEIDLPGHTSAALLAYPQLSEDGAAREPYEGMDVGHSSLAIGKEVVDRFVADVLREVTELTPGPYIHVGGDEALSTSDEDYLAFAKRLGEIVAPLGKTMVGWHELGRSTDLPAGTVGQYWNFTTPEEGAAEKAQTFERLIMSPGDVAYLDMKYDDHTEFGLYWANGPTSVREAYEWDPADIIPGLGDDRVLGVEAPLWSETVRDIDEIEYMAFPRIAGIAEIAWSPREGRTFDEYVTRLVEAARQWDAAGINYAHADGVTWRE